MHGKRMIVMRATDIRNTIGSHIMSTAYIILKSRHHGENVTNGTSEKI